MLIVDSYAVAVGLCFVTMLCWGSWANTLKLASKEWPFPLYYWDYAIGLVLTSLVLGLTIGSTGAEGRGFVADLRQASGGAMTSAFAGGVVFNLANLLIVAAIDVAGLAVAFPVAIGLALVIGVVVNYVATPLGKPGLSLRAASRSWWPRSSWTRGPTRRRARPGGRAPRASACPSCPGC